MHLWVSVRNSHTPHHISDYSLLVVIIALILKHAKTILDNLGRFNDV